MKQTPSLPPPPPSEPEEAKKASPTRAKPAVRKRAALPQISAGTDTGPTKPEKPQPRSLPLPEEPPARPGAGKLYWINVREEWDADFNQVFRLYNHNMLAGDRLYKGTSGPRKTIIAWPFEWEGWNTAPTAEEAEQRRAALQSYLDRIAAK